MLRMPCFSQSCDHLTNNWFIACTAAAFLNCVDSLTWHVCLQIAKHVLELIGISAWRSLDNCFLFRLVVSDALAWFRVIHHRLLIMVIRLSDLCDERERGELLALANNMVLFLISDACSRWYRISLFSLARASRLISIDEKSTNICSRLANSLKNCFAIFSKSFTWDGFVVCDSQQTEARCEILKNYSREYKKLCLIPSRWLYSKVFFFEMLNVFSVIFSRVFGMMKEI